MNSSISNQIGAVFIPVSDMQRAIEWYSRLLGQPVQATSHEGTIYDVPMAGQTGLLLDATPKPVTNSSQPLFFFWADNLQAAYEFLIAHGIEILSEIEDIGSVSFLKFKDPDNNLLMVCQRNQQ